MKRTFHILSVLALLIGLFGMTGRPVLAADPVVKITPASANLDVGQTITVYVEVANISNLFAVELHLGFDPNILEGERLLDQGRFADAAESFRRATQENPHDVEAQLRYADMLALQEKWAEAEAACRRAVQLDTGYAEPHAMLGMMFAEQRKWREAESAYREAIALEPDNFTHYGNLALILEDQGRMEEAQKLMRQAEAMTPIGR